MKVSKYDPDLFMHRYRGTLQGLLVTYVDDFLWGGDSSIVITRSNYVDSIEFLKLDGNEDKNDLLNETEIHDLRAFDRAIQLVGYANKARYPL